jgi:acetylornithine deacetylase/succinyl-diaminopimelate desuccinylase-like protein
MTARTLDLAAAIARASGEISEDAIVDALGVLTSRQSPPGGERPLALAVAEWGQRALPDMTWEVDTLDGDSANLFARSTFGTGSAELALYGHLDTSLTGWAPRDAAVTGTTSPPPALRIDVATRTASGFGVGVAKAPSAAGVIAFAAAGRALHAHSVTHRLTLVLAAGGTHRADPDGETTRFGRGVEHALASGWRPDAVLNVKAGPPGVLREEPAAAYLRVRVRGRWDAALARRVVAPDGGLARHTGTVVDAIETWRSGYVATHRPRGQLAPEIAIGAIRSGLPDKPDLLPGLLEVFVYAVLLPDEDPGRVARDLGAFLTPRVNSLPGQPAVEVEVYASAPGGTADAASAIVRLATAAWTNAFGETLPVREWTGATDGAIFLAHGIPTARMGPRVTRDAIDPRIEIVSLDQLTSAARAYAETAIRFFASPGARSAA